jgi:hypothetical protein
MNEEHESSSLVFWCCLIVGGAITLYGLHGLVSARRGAHGGQFVRWFLGADIAHDLIVAPAACLIGVLVVRLVPMPARAQVRAGVFATAIILAIAWAPLRGYGHQSAPGNSSVQPLDYATSVATALVAVWVLAGTWFVVSTLRRRHDPREADADTRATSEA